MVPARLCPSPWMVAPRSLAWNGSARVPAARVRVVADGGIGQPCGADGEVACGQVGQGFSLRSQTGSMMVWSRCWASAWIVSNGESVSRAW